MGAPQQVLAGLGGRYITTAKDYLGAALGTYGSTGVGTALVCPSGQAGFVAACLRGNAGSLLTVADRLRVQFATNKPQIVCFNSAGTAIINQSAASAAPSGAWYTFATTWRTVSGQLVFQMYVDKVTASPTGSLSAGTIDYGRASFNNRLGQNNPANSGYVGCIGPFMFDDTYYDLTAGGALDALFDSNNKPKNWGDGSLILGHQARFVTANGSAAAQTGNSGPWTDNVVLNACASSPTD